MASLSDELTTPMKVSVVVGWERQRVFIRVYSASLQYDKHSDMPYVADRPELFLKSGDSTAPGSIVRLDVKAQPKSKGSIRHER